VGVINTGQFAFSPIKAERRAAKSSPSAGNLIENFSLFELRRNFRLKLICYSSAKDIPAVGVTYMTTFLLIAFLSPVVVCWEEKQKSFVCQH
jgi:hypothetical protein